MIRSTREITKSKRPAQTGEPVLVRLQPDLARRIDAWRRDQHDLPGRPEAIRRLAEAGLAAKPRKRAKPG